MLMSQVECWLVSYVQQNKINEIGNNSDSWIMVLPIMTERILFSINQVFMQEQIILLIYNREVGQIQASWYIVTWRDSYSDGKGTTDQGHLTEKIMNKLRNIYGNTLEQNGVPLVVGTVYLNIAMSLILKTEICYYTIFL